MDAISGVSGLALQNLAAVGKMGSVIKDALDLEGKMALQLLQANLSTQAIVEDMNLTAQIVDLYV